MAQSPSEKPTISERNPGNRLLQFNMDMPKGVNDEQFVSGTADFPMMTNLALRLERSYFKAGALEQVGVGLAAKYFFDPKTYLFVGGEIHQVLGITPGGTQKPMMNLNVGLGKEVKSNLFLELQYKPGLGVPSPTAVPGTFKNKHNALNFKARF
ncbi:hypothetical protein [Maribacter sp. 2307ULW6-5]|uniref:hypothetical protein n=1 Tax=Maribacter sp. 2307ULW6-5 TaxID=3386275 RepID=UPI0039BCE68C